MEERKAWVTSYSVKAHELYITFPLKKYLTIYYDFSTQDLRNLCGKILKQMFFYAIEDIIENNVTLKFPPGCNAWLEIQAYSGENFKRARQNGAFLDVDFLASNFTGYLMIMRFTNRYGKWQKRMYLSARHRDRITYLTNQGKQLTSARVKQVRDYVNKLQEKYPILSKSEINKICTYGLKKFAYCIRLHCDVYLGCRNDEDILSGFCGILYLDNERFWKNWYVKWRMKERLLYHLRKIPWDGYYYIGLNREQHELLISQKGRLKHFKNVYLVKVKKELDHDRACYHVWRVPYISDCGWKFFREKIDTDKAEYIGPNKYDSIHKLFRKRDGV